MSVKTIYDEILTKLAPKFIKKNTEIKVIEKVIKKHILENIKYLVFLDRIAEMNEKELDYVADELHVDFYDYTMTLEEKRESCKQSFSIHATKGTVGAVKKVLDIFFPNAELQQWYEYGGTPGHFKVEITGNTPDNLDKLLERVEDSKKKSQHLEELKFLSNSNQLYYGGSFLIQGIKQDIIGSEINFYFGPSTINQKSNKDKQFIVR